MSSDTIPTTCARVLRGHRGPVNAIRFNAKGTYVMTCGQDKSVRLWNPHRDDPDTPTKGLLVKTYEGRHGYDVQDVAIADDNSKFASCGRDKMIFLWDVPTGRVIRKFEGHDHTINCVRYNDDASVLLSGSYDKTVRAWDIRARNSFRPIQTLDEFKDSVTSLVVTDHEIIAGSVDGTLCTFDLRNSAVYRDHIQEPVVCVTRSPDDRYLLAGCMDGTLRLLDRNGGKQLHSYQGHQMDSYRIDSCFSLEGGHVLSGSEDGRVYSWDLVTGDKSTFPAHSTPVRAIAAHPETPLLVSASTDGSVKVWANKMDE